MNTSLCPSKLAHLDHVNLNLAARTSSEAVHELYGGLRRLDASMAPERLLRDLLDRQAIGANCLDAEIALPHARTRSVSRLVAAVGLSTNGVEFDDQHPAIRLVVVIGVPFASIPEYLQWTSYFARSLRNPVFRQALLAATTEKDFRAAWSLGLGQLVPMVALPS